MSMFPSTRLKPTLLGWSSARYEKTFACTIGYTLHMYPAICIYPILELIPDEHLQRLRCETKNSFQLQKTIERREKRP